MLVGIRGLVAELNRANIVRRDVAWDTEAKYAMPVLPTTEYRLQKLSHLSLVNKGKRCEEAVAQSKTNRIALEAMHPCSAPP